MSEQQIYENALRKQAIIIQNNQREDFYKTDEYLFILIKDIVDGLKFSKYCTERI
ncbi:MAG: hypothetical protein K2F59_06095 [Eubacteriales bacterium]|nr:hypothetical protein [Eubacteriales bacterium]